MDFKPKTTEKKGSLPFWVPPILQGTAAALAELISYPLENIKVRMQMNDAKNYSVSYSSTIDCLKKTIDPHGIKGYYRGAQVSMGREALFHSTRYVTYDEVKRYFLADVEGSGYYRRLLSALTASGISLLFGNILDIARIRYIADLHTKTYSSSAQIIKNIIGAGGIKAATRGYILNLLRQSFFMGAELFAQDQTKMFLVKKKGFRKDSNLLLILSGIAGSFFTSLVGCPVDVLRTRYFSQLGGDIDPIYKNPVRAFVYMLKTEGLLCFYKGILPFILKNCVFSTSLFVGYEVLKRSSQEFLEKNA